MTINPDHVIMLAVGVIIGAGLQSGRRTHGDDCVCTECERTRWMMGEKTKRDDPGMPPRKPHTSMQPSTMTPRTIETQRVGPC